MKDTDILTLNIALLGPFQARVGAAAAEFRTDAERTLLAYLAAHQGNAQRRDTLAGLLSPDRPDIEALTYLRNRLTRLRSALGDDDATPPWFEIDRKQISLRVGDDITVDLTQFEQHLVTVERHAHRQLAGCPACLARMQAAVDLLRGEVLAGLNFPSETWEIWLAAQREHYQQRALEALTWLREARLARGEWAAALDIAQRQLRLEPWLEAAYRTIMVAHYQLGDRNAALAQFEQCQQRLWDELGVELEEETEQLRQQIFDNALVVAGAVDVPNNLPLQNGLFFGREAEQAQLLQRLVDPNYRLITIVGAGGMGKTRLSIEVGAQVKASFPDGVWLVPLDAISGGAEQITIAIGEAAGLAHAGNQLTGEQVLAILREKRMLLIFDNCELLLDELAFIPEWLRRAPQIAIVATSREPLNFQAESLVALAGLPSGAAQISAAEAMFAERGRAARAEFALSAENLPQVQQICALVDGSPLGIALAAAWVRRRSLKQICDQIGGSLDFLSTRLRDIDPRHRSMRAVFETSWQLLDAETQQVLAALSAFPTTFTAAAAAAVAAASQLDLDLLCEKSLLQQQHEPESYLMHGLLRQFAADKREAHGASVDHAFVDYFDAFARAHHEDYDGLQPEWRNLSAAIGKAYALAAWQAVLDLVWVLDEPWFRQIRFSDMREGLTLALDAATTLSDLPALARVLLRLGEIEIELNDYAAAEAHLADATRHFTRLEDSLGIAHATYLLGRIKLEQAQDDQALALSSESKRLSESENDWLGVARNLNQLALLQIKKHRDFQTAHAYLEQSVALQRSLPPSPSYLEALRHLARIKGMFETYADAEQCLIEATAVSQQQRNVGEYAAVLYERLLLCKKRQQFDAALAFGYECLASFKQLGSLRWEALIKTQLGLLHQAKHDPRQALPLLEAGLQIFCELGDAYEQAYSYYYLGLLYVELNEIERSHDAQQHARRLNRELNDPQLTERLKAHYTNPRSGIESYIVLCCAAPACKVIRGNADWY